MSDKKPLIRVLCSIDTANLDKKVKLSPIGESIRGLDGRTFDVDGAMLLASLNTNDLELPLTVDHGWSAKYGADAAAWFNEFELREDGIYAKMELNDLGQELIESKKYKYLSPEYLMQYDSSVVEELVGMGLVNQPNLLNESLNHQKKEPTDMAMTDEEKAKQQALEDENNQLKQQQQTLTDEMSQMKKDQLTQKVENAIAKGELLPAKKEFALGLEENALNSFLEMEAKNKVISKNSIDPERDGNDSIDSDDEIYSQLGL